MASWQNGLDLKSRDYPEEIQRQKIINDLGLRMTSGKSRIKTKISRKF